ncbi:hypothetical protein KAU34_10150, partial [candidate division WOR-3 bacterium]|nr:hypothetical protein [candidate division WOR-3 bacterium]
LLKENNPGLTVRKAKEILKKDGVNISIKGIWGIWKRYGYAGFRKEELSNNFIEYCSWTKEAIKKFEQAKEIYNLGNTMGSAQILNSIPVLPKNDFILQIHDNHLNLRRRVEKISSLFGKIPVQTYLKKVRALHKECKKKNLYYSALRTGIAEVIALSWTGEPMKQLKKTEELKKILKRTGNHFSYSLLALQFSLLISEGITCAHLLKIERASEIAKLCRKILRRRKYSPLDFMFNLGILNTHLDNFIEAEYWYSRSLEKAGGKLNKLIKVYLANILFHKGEYREAIQILKNAELPVWGLRSRKLFYQSIQSLINGMPHEAILSSTKILSILKKENIHSRIFRAYFTIASSYCSIGEKAKAESIIKRLVPFLVKSELRKQTTILGTLLSQSQNPQTQNLLIEDILPSVKLAVMLKNGDYWRAFKYADKRGMKADLHRYVFFFPKTVIRIIEKGKPTGLPKTMLQLPVFNKEIPVYHIKFLGNLIIYKKQKYLKEKLSPKDSSFLIYLVSSRRKSISLDRIYKNFWRSSKHPSRNLAHLLVRIRKTLRLSSDYLYIKEKRLFFDCYFTTDYGEYMEYLAQAKALERAGEWGFAKR